jgi:hypothetical protein
MKGSVFLSHASDDRDRIVALGLIQVLQSTGLTVFVDTPERFQRLPRESMKALVSIGLDEMWRRDLARLLEKANVVLACWSNNYARKLSPENDDLQKGQYIRDEIQDARVTDYLAHVVIDRVDRFPAPYTSLNNDRQLLKLFEVEGNSDARENGIERLSELISKIIRRRRAKELGPRFESHVTTALRFINRFEQEEPLRPRIAQDDPVPGLYILFGPKAENPELLYERFCEFTMPAREYLKNNRQNWNGVLIGYMTSSLILEPWQKSIVVNWPHAQSDERSQTPSCDLALARIADQIALALPRVKRLRTDKPFQRVLRTIALADQFKRTSIFAYSFIDAKRWKDERVSICAVINALGKELADSSVDSFRFLVVIENAGRDRGWFPRWFLRMLGRSSEEFGKKEGGPSSVGLKGRPIWHRLPDLVPVKDTDFNVWAGLLAEAWGLDALVARQTLSDKFVREISLGPASKELRDNVLPDLWLRSKLAER